MGLRAGVARPVGPADRPYVAATEPGWVLGALAVVVGPLFAQSGRAAWLVVGALGAAALVVIGVRARRPWVAAVGIAGVFVSVPLAVAELFDARLGPLVGILAVGLALVAAAVGSLPRRPLNRVRDAGERPSCCSRRLGSQPGCRAPSPGSGLPSPWPPACCDALETLPELRHPAVDAFDIGGRARTTSR